MQKVLIALPLVLASMASAQNQQQPEPAAPPVEVPPPNPPPAPAPPVTAPPAMALPVGAPSALMPPRQPRAAGGQCGDLCQQNPATRTRRTTGLSALLGHGHGPVPAA